MSDTAVFGNVSCWDGLAVALPGMLLLGPDGARMVAVVLERISTVEGHGYSPAAAQLHALTSSVSTGAASSGSARRPRWDGFGMAVGPDRLLLGPEAAGLVAGALKRVRAAERYFSPDGDQVLQAALNVAFRARRGHEDMAGGEDLSDSQAWISTSQAALRIGVSKRHARRLALEGKLGETRLQSNRIRVQAAEVDAYAVTRPQSRQAS